MFRQISMTQENLRTDLSLTAEIKLYYDLFVPDHAEAAPLLIAVHGYGAHKRHMMREARLIAPGNFVIASVQAPHQHYSKLEAGYRIGFGWLTDHKPEESVALHHKFLLDLIERLESDGLIDSRRIYLYGFSQACAINFRFAFTYPEILRGVIAACGGIPGDLETNPDYQSFDAETFYFYGDDDEYYTPEKFAAFEAELRGRLPNFRSLRYHAKHVITQEMRDDIKAFLLKAEAR